MEVPSGKKEKLRLSHQSFKLQDTRLGIIVIIVVLIKIIKMMINIIMKITMV